MVFSQVDTAADQLARARRGRSAAPRALARIYDDVVHVVVPASSPAATLADLRGARVSLGAPDSGVHFIAERLLAAAGLAPRPDFQALRLGIDESVDAVASGEIDAFFWSGGLPTRGVTDARGGAADPAARTSTTSSRRCAPRTRSTPRAPSRRRATASRTPVTTLLVRNFLLVGAGMPDDVASALVQGCSPPRNSWRRSSPAALTIDLRAAIGTQPVPLHPGAESFFRSQKDP